MNVYPSFIEKTGLGQTSNLVGSVLHCYQSILKCLGGMLLGHLQGSMPSLHLKCILVLHLPTLLSSAVDLAVAKSEGEDAVVLMTYILQLTGFQDTTTIHQVLQGEC